MDIDKCNINFGNLKIKTVYFGQYKVYEDTPPVPLYVTFSSPNTFTIAQAGTKKTWDGTLYYSTDAQNWNIWDGTTTLSSSSTGDTKYLYMRGTGNSYITGDTSSRYWRITGSNISISGNTETLLDYQDVELGNHPTIGTYAFTYWLYNNTSIVDCSNLILGTPTLNDYCYYRMFESCTSLTTAPTISATTLATSCCNSMFFGCSSLTTPPALPAMTMAQNCYYAMFYACTSLTTAPELPAITLAYSCYSMMFYQCTNLTALPALPATTLVEKCYRSMFEYASKIKLSTTQTGNYQTPYRIPISGIGTTAYDVLSYMFSGTGGTFAGTPAINTTYYTSNEVI